MRSFIFSAWLGLVNKVENQRAQKRLKKTTTPFSPQLEELSETKRCTQFFFFLDNPNSPHLSPQNARTHTNTHTPFSDFHYFCSSCLQRGHKITHNKSSKKTFLNMNHDSNDERENHESQRTMRVFSFSFTTFRIPPTLPSETSPIL